MKKGKHIHIKRPWLIVQLQRRTYITRLLIRIASIYAFVLGVHGLYAYFYFWEELFEPVADQDWEYLFFSIPIASPFSDTVEWMTQKGVISWFLPIVFIIVSIIIFVLSTRISVKLGSPSVKRWKAYGSILLSIVAIWLLFGLTSGSGIGCINDPYGDTVATKQINPWLYTLHKVNRSDTDQIVWMSITNVSDEPKTWSAGTVRASNPDIVCVDQYGEVFEPVNHYSLWNTKIYPDEVVRYKFEFKLHEKSGDTKLYVASFGFQPRDLLFKLQ